MTSQGVGAVAHDDDAADRLPVAVPLGDAAPHLGADGHRADVATAGSACRRRAAPTAAFSSSRGVGDVALDAQDVLGLRHLHDAAADLVVGALDRLPHLAQRDVVGAQLLRIDRDLILLDEAADAGDLGDALDRRELVLQVPVLDAAQLLQVAVRAGERCR